jgi:hypothetical protein
MKRKRLEQSGLFAIKQLRASKLNSGLTFMINSADLPADQCYLEYPDGKIRIVTIATSTNDFKIISELTAAQSRLVKKQLELS